MAVHTSALQGVYVSEEAFKIGGEELLTSNATFIGELLGRVPVDLSEVSDTANMSCLAEVFRYHGLHDGIDAYLKMIFPFDLAMSITRKALVAMGATEHLAIFDKTHGIATDMGDANFQRFKRGRFDVDNKTQTLFMELREQLSLAEKKHSLIDYNAAWLSAHPDLHVLSARQWDQKLEELAAEVTQMQRRAGEFTKTDSRASRIALALSKMAGLEFESLTTMEPRLQVEGKNFIGFNFKTRQGAYFFYENNGDAILHEQVTMNPVCKMQLGDKFPE